MTTEEIINIVLASIGGATVALGVAYYLFKTLVEHLLKKEALRFSAQLDEKTEVLKSRLSIYAHEQNIGLNRIDQQRASVIQSIYGIITQWHDAALEVAAPQLVSRNSDQEVLSYYYSHVVRMGELSDELATAVRDSAILFDQSSYEKLAEYGQSVAILSTDFISDTIASEAYKHDPNVDRVLGDFDRRRSRLRKDLKAQAIDGAREILIDEFRALMKADRSTGR